MWEELVKKKGRWVVIATYSDPLMMVGRVFAPYTMIRYVGAS